MRVKAYIKFKGNFKLTYIGRIGKNGVFKFRNNQLRKACLNKLKETFHYDCPGGSLTIPGFDSRIYKFYAEDFGFLICYSKVIPQKEDKKNIVTFWKNKV